MSLSVVILTKNEEKHIKGCLDSLKWCNEIVIVDDYSSDKTVDIAKNLGAKIYKNHLIDFSSQREFGLSKANGEWVLFVDADERISDALAFEISNMTSQWPDNLETNYSGFYIRRSDVFLNKQLRYGESGGIYLLRLGKKNKGKWIGKIHESWSITGRIGKLKNVIVHYPHKDIYEFLRKINYYTDIRAQELYDKKISSPWWSIIVYPFCKFLVNYVLKRGILDGERGLIVAIIMSFHSFLVRGKIWLKTHVDKKI